MISYFLETQRLWLRYFFENDAQKVYKMSREEGIRKWIPDQVYAVLQEAKEALAYLSSHYKKVPVPQKNPFVVGIVLKETEELIGHVGLSPFGKQFVEIGFAIETKEQGKGYASEAVVTMTKWALNQLKIPFLVGIAAKENQASQNVLEKCGYYFLKEMKLQSTGKQCKIYTIPETKPLSL